MFDAFKTFVDRQPPDRPTNYKNNCGCPLAIFMNRNVSVGGMHYTENGEDHPIPRFLTYRMADENDDDNSTLNAETYGQLAQRLNAIRPWNGYTDYPTNTLVHHEGKVWRSTVSIYNPLIEPGGFAPGFWEDMS